MMIIKLSALINKSRSHMSKLFRNLRVPCLNLPFSPINTNKSSLAGASDVF